MRIGFSRRMCLVLAAAAVSGAGWVAPACARNGAWYVGGEFGAMIVEDTTAIILPNRLEDSFRVLNNQYGYDGDINVGYDLGLFRIEGEVSHKRIGINGTSVNGGPVIDTSGSISALSFMVNGMLDFGDEDGLSGFVGGGVGIARVDFNNLRVFANQSPFLDDSDSRLAWQVFVGVRQAISSNVDVTLKYRFFNVPDVKFQTVAGNSGYSTISSHSLLGGITFNFGAPPPSPR